MNRFLVARKCSFILSAFVIAIVAVTAGITMVHGQAVDNDANTTTPTTSTLANDDTSAATTATANNDNDHDNDNAFSCVAICGEGLDDKVLSSTTPDLIVEYNWNPRVPTCSGMSCETDTCSALERKLPFYQEDEFECNRHRNGLQMAGCECSGSPTFRLSLIIIGVVVATTITTAMATI